MSQQEQNDKSQHFYRASAADFMKIPGSPVAYSASDSIRDLFKHGVLSEYVDTRLGMATADNNKFLRLWYEVSFSSAYIIASNRDEAKESGKRWFPYQKGGDFRKWYGNYDYLVNWKNDGEEIQNFKDELTGKIRSHNYNLDHIFKRGVTWNALTSGKTSARISENSLFDNAGSSLFVKASVTNESVMGLINSKIMLEVFPLLSPTLNYQPGDISKLPAFFPEELQNELNKIVSSLIRITKIDWDSYEESWDFKYSPFIDLGNLEYKVQKIFRQIRNSWGELVKQVESLEQQLNNAFIVTYGLTEDLNPTHTYVLNNLSC